MRIRHSETAAGEDRSVGVEPWRPVSEERVEVDVGLLFRGGTASVGEQLDHGLEMDRKLRDARARELQARVNAAHRQETRARSACVAAGMAALPLWLWILIQVTSDAAQSLGLLFGLVGVAVATLLPTAAATAVVAARWRKHLLRVAEAQHLEVHDPGQVDYR